MRIKKAIKAAKTLNSINSFEVLGREWLASHMQDKSVSHSNKTIRRFESYIFPWLGKTPIADITPQQLLTVVKRIHNKLETSHRVLNACAQVFRYAVQTGRAPRDITADLKGALPSPAVKHMASFTEPKDVAQLLRAIDAFKGSFTVECALRLAPLVFTRPSELRRAKWVDIDLDAAEWRYLVTKTKTDHIVHCLNRSLKY